MGCASRCYEIGGPWITFDPECPVHGYDAQREQADKAAEDAEKEERLNRLEARIESLENEIRRVRSRAGIPPRGMPMG